MFVWIKLTHVQHTVSVFFSFAPFRCFLWLILFATVFRWSIESIRSRNIYYFFFSTRGAHSDPLWCEYSSNRENAHKIHSQNYFWNFFCWHCWHVREPIHFNAIFSRHIFSICSTIEKNKQLYFSQTKFCSNFLALQWNEILVRILSFLHSINHFEHKIYSFIIIATIVTSWPNGSWRACSFLKLYIYMNSFFSLWSQTITLRARHTLSWLLFIRRFAQQKKQFHTLSLCAVVTTIAMFRVCVHFCFDSVIYTYGFQWW